MKVGSKSRAMQSPARFNMQKLMNGTYALTYTEGAEEISVPGGESGAVHTEYEYSEFCSVAQVDGYETAAAALVSLKYTYADEFALMRKGMADSTNAEYQEYVAYVEACKAFARTKFGE